MTTSDRPSHERTRERTRRPSWPEEYIHIIRCSPHAGGLWRCRYNGRELWLTPWTKSPDGDPAAALAEFRRRRLLIDADIDIKSGDIRGVTDAYLFHQKDRVKKSEIEEKTYEGYRDTVIFLRRTISPTLDWQSFGPTHAQQILDALSPYRAETRKARIRNIRMISNWAHKRKIGALDFGPDFKGPSRTELRREARERQHKQYTPEQIRCLLAHADPDFQTAILLAINCGFDNAGLAELDWRYIHLKPSDATGATIPSMPGGWIDQSRGKTEIARRAPLWPETATALLEMQRRRPFRQPAAPEYRHLVFLTDTGMPYQRDDSKTDILINHHRQIRPWCGIDKSMLAEPLGFRDLKRTAATIGARHNDDLARRLVFGHVVEGVAERYVLAHPDDRLVDFVRHIRDWLFLSPPLDHYPHDKHNPLHGRRHPPGLDPTKLNSATVHPPASPSAYSGWWPSLYQRRFTGRSACPPCLDPDISAPPETPRRRVGRPPKPRNPRRPASPDTP